MIIVKDPDSVIISKDLVVTPKGEIHRIFFGFEKPKEPPSFKYKDYVAVSMFDGGMNGGGLRAFSPVMFNLSQWNCYPFTQFNDTQYMVLFGHPIPYFKSNFYHGFGEGAYAFHMHWPEAEPFYQQLMDELKKSP